MRGAAVLSSLFAGHPSTGAWKKRKLYQYFRNSASCSRVIIAVVKTAVFSLCFHHGFLFLIFPCIVRDNSTFLIDRLIARGTSSRTMAPNFGRGGSSVIIGKFVTCKIELRYFLPTVRWVVQVAQKISWDPAELVTKQK